VKRKIGERIGESRLRGNITERPQELDASEAPYGIYGKHPGARFLESRLDRFAECLVLFRIAEEQNLVRNEKKCDEFVEHMA
jgi:hypothetical protein